ncbi:hypothetical protein Salat_2667200 [Sesamum alatum]|uniref:Pectinesterase inhibitor domain-containing protein n=1 Tax=Sesamum alatum TaxID=300844 RepID=A0AAE1XPC1_9LAMI|nr:hypothetical protein Salat_2667200 [Sesamum alatum]
MAIFGQSVVLILVSIVFMLLASSSIGHKLTDVEIKQLCSKTNYLEGCYKLLKSDPRTGNVDARGLAEVSVALASKKANKIHSLLNSLVSATHNSRLRNIYKLCSSNYNDVVRDLKVIKNYLHSSAYKNIPVQVKDAAEEIKQCKKAFGVEPSDHVQIKKKMLEFELVLSIVDVTSDNLNKK